MSVTFKMEGVEDLARSLEDIASKPTQRNVLRRVLKFAGEPIAEQAAAMAPVQRGILAFSIAVSPTLTRRHRGEKRDEVEMHIGPAGGQGALFYASAVEFGTVNSPAQPFMRPAWGANQINVLNIIKSQLAIEIDRAAARAARKAARLAA